MNSSCAILTELDVNLLLDQLSVSANLQIVLIGYQNIGKIPYQCITTVVSIESWIQIHLNLCIRNLAIYYME